MKLIKLSAVVLTQLIMSCADLREAETLRSSSLEMDNDGVQQCLDSKMEQWYKAFNHYQLEGYNMFAADLKALQEANAVYENCRAQKNAGKNKETAVR